MSNCLLIDGTLPSGVATLLTVDKKLNNSSSIVLRDFANVPTKNHL